MSNTFTAQIDRVAFTHRLIALGVHTCPATYAALIAAFTAAQDNQIDAGFAALTEWGAPDTRTLSTLNQTIDKIVSEWR